MKKMKNKSLGEEKWVQHVYYAVNKIAADNKVSRNDMCMVLTALILNAFKKENDDPEIVKKFFQEVSEEYERAFEKEKK